VKPLTELEPPRIDLTSLNGPQVTELMQDAGLL
jgi:iron(III) transport system substrate-binding protein